MTRALLVLVLAAAACGTDDALCPADPRCQTLVELVAAWGPAGRCAPEVKACGDGIRCWDVLTGEVIWCPDPG